MQQAEEQSDCSYAGPSKGRAPAALGRDGCPSWVQERFSEEVMASRVLKDAKEIAWESWTEEKHQQRSGQRAVLCQGPGATELTDLGTVGGLRGSEMTCGTRQGSSRDLIRGSLAARVRSPGAAEPSARALEAGDRPAQTTCRDQRGWATLKDIRKGEEF